MSSDNDSLAHVGIKGGDYVYAQPAERELQPGEVAALYKISATSWHAGIVESVTPDTITLTYCGKLYEYQRADLEDICRVTWYARRFRPVPATPAAKLSQLRQRLARLDADDITDSTAAFKLEKQIYDLERESAADEWPEVIGA